MAAAAVSSALGLAVMAGWHLHGQRLFSVSASFGVMHYNDALAFLVCGGGLFSYYFKRGYPGSACGVAAAAIGIISLFQFITGIDTGIDRLIIKDTANYTDAMAPGAAAGFTAAGAAIFVMGSALFAGQRPFILGLLGAVAVSLGVNAFFGHLTGLTAINARGGFVLMAVPSAIGITVIGVGIGAAAWQDAIVQEGDSVRWFPVLAGISALAGTLLLWRVSVVHDRAQAERMIKLKSDVVTEAIYSQMESRVLALLRMAKRWEMRVKPARREWEADASLYVRHYSGYLAIECVDGRLRPRWAVHAGGTAAYAATGAKVQEIRKGVLMDARGLRQPRMSRAIPIEGGGGAVLAALPIYEGNDFQGAILGAFRLKDILDGILAREAAQGYSVKVFDGTDELYSHEAAGTTLDKSWERESGVELYGISWRVRVVPSAQHVARTQSHLSEAILAAGVVVSTLIAIVIYLEQAARRRAAFAEAVNAELEKEVAERRRAEEAAEKSAAQLERSNSELEQEVRERIRAEEAAERHAAELERSNSELEQFAYVASHDLQEPLRIVAGYVQLLSRRYKGRLDGEADEFIAYTVDGATRMQRLISDLLAYSRVGRLNEFTSVDTAAVFSRSVENLKAMIDESGAVVTHGALPEVFADPAQLDHLFLNLIGNAIKYRREVGARVHVSAVREGQQWRFSVSDNGIGIDPRHYGRIFSIFQRLHAKDKYPGTGIGLSICKKVVENHGGRIWVESRPGEGSDFIFTIPIRSDNR